MFRFFREPFFSPSLTLSERGLEGGIGLGLLRRKVRRERGSKEEGSEGEILLWLASIFTSLLRTIFI